MLFIEPAFYLRNTSLGLLDDGQRSLNDVNYPQEARSFGG